MKTVFETFHFIEIIDILRQIVRLSNEKKNQFFIQNKVIISITPH